MRRLAAFLAALICSGFALAPGAGAQGITGPMALPLQETGTSVSFTPGQENTDPTNSVIISTAVYEGSVTGSPIIGGFRVEEVRTRPVDAGSGSVEGQFTLQDRSGSTIYGDISGDFTLAPGSTSASGQFTIRGGTGAFATISGTGTFSTTVQDAGPAPGGTAIVSFTSDSISMNGLPGPERIPFGGGFNGLVPGSLPPGYTPPSYAAIYGPPPSYVGPGYVPPNPVLNQPDVVFVPVPSQPEIQPVVQPQVIVVPRITSAQRNDGDDDDHHRGNNRGNGHDERESVKGHSDNGRHRGDGH